MISKTKIKNQKRERRHRRIRGKVFGTSERPRLSVYRSNQHLYAELIDDQKGHTIVSSSDISVKGSGTPMEKAKEIGKDLASKASEKKIKGAVFDRGGFIFTGRIKALADGAREGGLVF